MFRIRRVYDNILPINRSAIDQIEAIMRVQFEELSRDDLLRIRRAFAPGGRHLMMPFLFVTDDAQGRVRGFAFLTYFPDIRACFLDFLSTARLKTSFGLGGALYERVREEVLALKTDGLFFECLPDDPRVCSRPHVLKQNQARLAFYERYGARPLVNSFHKDPLPGQEPPPYVVFDGLNRQPVLSRDRVRQVVRTILMRKYARQCPPSYVKKMIESFKDDPVPLRPFQYLRREAAIPINTAVPADKRIALVVNDRHHIHHVREKGYVESPVRVGTIFREIKKSDTFQRIKIRNFPEKHITAVHDSAFVRYLKRISFSVKPRQSVYPYLFPLRNRSRPPLDLIDRAGYYCIDTFTPINRKAWIAARQAVNASLTAAEEILRGRPLAYALVRPPGHHAERHVFGGFCYLNSAAIAAQYLSAYGKVAILDLDHHHGNGQEDIFYERNDVLTVSIHVHPRFDYPLFTGFADERGRGQGEGFNMNLPLPKFVEGKVYRVALKKALRRVGAFSPNFLVVALGLDSAKGDPTGSWRLYSRDFEANGRLIGHLHLPTLVVQEGGYNNRQLGVNARRFFAGLWTARDESVHITHQRRRYSSKSANSNLS